MIYQIFTFGFGQKHQNGYAKIYGKDENDCKQKMFKHFGKEWCTNYPDEEAAGVERFGLHCVKVIDEPKCN